MNYIQNQEAQQTRGNKMLNTFTATEKTLWLATTKSELESYKKEIEDRGEKASIKERKIRIDGETATVWALLISR